MTPIRERTVVLLKPDALQRNLLGKIIERFEQKGLKVAGLKMMQLEDVLLDEHYGHHKEKPFFEGLKSFMKSSPIVAMVLEGLEAVKVVRTLCGPTLGREAQPGTIRGDFSMSVQANIVHSSDSLETAEIEITRFFNEDELFEYDKIDLEQVYVEDEREGVR
jgi:nucleoside-diphosphate kinase